MSIAASGDGGITFGVYTGVELWAFDAIKKKIVQIVKKLCLLKTPLINVLKNLYLISIFLKSISYAE
jgi:hypothetical protein